MTPTLALRTDNSAPTDNKHHSLEFPEPEFPGKEPDLAFLFNLPQAATCPALEKELKMSYWGGGGLGVPEWLSWLKVQPLVSAGVPVSGL